MKYGIELRVSGVVQGVGFRPFIYRLAHKYGLVGSVANGIDGVVIKVSYPSLRIFESFRSDIKEKAPPLARIDRIEQKSITLSTKAFEILTSDASCGGVGKIPPDIALCNDCLTELFNQEDRRYRYPFINCTNCGPRFSIIKTVPYDRPYTSMNVFDMCFECAVEYHDPFDRRFHAQPDSCWNCGPELAFHEENDYWQEPQTKRRNNKTLGDPIGRAAEALKNGKIVALKGIGGFHLAVDAASEKGVLLLRMRKKRKSKPLAIMVAGIDTVNHFCHLSKDEEALMLSLERPIVLLRKKCGIAEKGSNGVSAEFPHSKAADGLATALAPGVNELGIVLPYSPVHYLLFAHPATPRTLVMTSANQSGEPICIENNHAFEKLSGIADTFLIHNREILTRVDDSIARVTKHGITLLRRARGYVPTSIKLSVEFPPNLACGAELKNTFCLTKFGQAFLSQHIGNLTSIENLNFFEESIHHFQKLLQIEPEFVVCDQHPDYLGTRYANSRNLPVLAVQHHHAHAVSVMAEHGIEDDVIAVVMDGTGYGEDSTIWGGEVLQAGLSGYNRLAHLQCLFLPGGDVAAKEIWRMGVSVFFLACGLNKETERDAFLEKLKGGTLPAALDRIAMNKKEILAEMIRKGVNTPLSSSCGRLFDGVAALLGLRLDSEYEGQAAMELEALAWLKAEDLDAGEDVGLLLEQSRGFFSIAIEQGNLWTIGLEQMLATLLDCIKKGIDKGLLALEFHFWLIMSIAQTVKMLSIKKKIKKVVLTGGCMQNRLLLEGLFHVLKQEGLSVYTGKMIPVNDGGLALGQAVVGGVLYVSGRTHENY